MECESKVYGTLIWENKKILWGLWNSQMIEAEMVEITHAFKKCCYEISNLTLCLKELWLKVSVHDTGATYFVHLNNSNNNKKTNKQTNKQQTKLKMKTRKRIY